MEGMRGPVPGPLVRVGVTPRELDVFWLVGKRLRNIEIAERLFIGERTVESHVASLLRKLGGDDRRALISLAETMRAGRRPDRGLPSIASSFVGRGPVLAELEQLIRRHRVVTLIGPAGAGKTRLALEIASVATDRPAPYFVDLAAVDSDDGVLQAIAEAVGPMASADLRGALRAAVGAEPTWLVIDNCEHVIAALARLLADLVSASDRLEVLATSRHPVGIPGEVVYVVPPLELPSETADPATVLATEAGRLFIDRAAAAAPGFRITAANADAVAEICRRLDGLPLAIELASGRVRAFSPHELLKHLDESFAVLAAAEGGTVDRHRSLEAALDWSYLLLGDDERVVFERCGVFPGSFDFDTAAAIVAAPPVERSELVRILPLLLDRSLLSSRRLPDETTEYHLLDSFRAFARAKLVQAGALDEIERRHAEYHLRHAVALTDDLRGRQQLAALHWFDRRWPDLRVAMGWALDHDLSLATDFFVGIGTAWDIVGTRSEVYDWLEILLAQPGVLAERGGGAALTVSMLLCYRDPGRALAIGRAALEGSEGEHEQALARVAACLPAAYFGNHPSAVDELIEAREALGRAGDHWHEAYTLQVLGLTAEGRDTKVGFHASGADLFGRLGDDVLRANCLILMAAEWLDDGAEIDAAEAWLDEASALAARTGNLHEQLHADLHLARCSLRRADDPDVGSRFGSLVAGFHRVGDLRCVGRSLLGRAQAAEEAGDHTQAIQDLLTCARVAVGIPERRIWVVAFDGLARYARRAGAAELAVHLDLASAEADATGASDQAQIQELIDEATHLLGSAGHTAVDPVDA